jgi:hypothetical protein
VNKLLAAVGAAEVVGDAFVVVGVAGGGDLDFHAADGLYGDAGFGSESFVGFLLFALAAKQA